MCDQQFAPGAYVGRTFDMSVRYGDQDAFPIGLVRTQPAQAPHHLLVYFPHPEDRYIPEDRSIPEDGCLPEDRSIRGGWILPCQREYRICDLVPSTAAAFQSSTGDPAVLAAQRDQYLARAAAADLPLKPDDFSQIGADLYLDGMDPGDWIDAMTAD